MAFSVIISYILIKYTSGPFLKIVKALAVFGIVIHELTHLLMCIITHAPIENVTLIKKYESEKSEAVRYYGAVHVQKNRISFLQAFLISFAPLYLSFWLFFFILNFLINNQVSPLIFFLSFFILISLTLSAAPSFADLAIIPKAFQNDNNHSLYQILLIILSILTTWMIIFVFKIQFIHELFIYLVIAGFYFTFKYTFKFMRNVLKHFYQTSIENYRRPKKLKIKRFTRHHYKPKKYD